MDHHVDLTVGQIGLRPPEVGRQLLPGGLLDHARPGEAKERARLGDDHVGQSREAGKHAARRRMCEHRHEWEGMVREEVERDHGLGHLHEREDALLHAGPPRCRDNHQRDRLVDGCGDETREPLPDHGAHRAAQKAEVHDPEPGPLSADATHAPEERLGEARLELSVRQAVGVGAAVEEIQGITRSEVTRDLHPGTRIGQLGDAIRSGHRKMVGAVGADEERRLELLLGQRVIALCAPRNLRLGRRPRDRGLLRCDLDGDVSAHALTKTSWLDGLLGGDYSSWRPKTMVALCPPKPKLLEAA